MKEKKSKKKSKKHSAPAADGTAGLAERLELQRTRVICGPELNYHVRGRARPLRSEQACMVHTSPAWRPPMSSCVCTQAAIAAAYANVYGAFARGRARCVQVNTVTSALAYMSVGVDNSWVHDAWARQFEIVITRRESDLLEFEMIGVDPSITNALRRILISEVPTVAIEHVFVIDNTSEMAEEVLSHRLGLVPLAVDAEALEERGDVANEKNTVVFKLHVQCKRVRPPILVPVT